MNMADHKVAPLDWKDYTFLGVVCLFAMILFVANNDFPLYFHTDEVKKLKFVQTGLQDFKHPILMLQLGRVATYLLNVTDPQGIIVICRTLSALCGISIMISCFLICRLWLNRTALWFATALIACLPIIVVHSHYYKEDMFFTASTFFALLAYFRFLRNPVTTNTLLFGLGLGLALSAQYKAVLLIPLVLLFPLIETRVGQRSDYKPIYIGILIALAIAGLLAMMINYPALLQPHKLLGGISSEATHVSFGHTLKIYPLPHYFSFHLIHSLVPGLTTPIVVISLFGLLLGARYWNKAPMEIRFLLIYTLIFYLAHEITPMKPAPGFMRYMIPIAPVLVIFAAWAIQWLGNVAQTNWKLISQRQWPLVTTMVMLMLLSWPAYNSIKLVQNFNEHDTRTEAYNWLSDQDSTKAVYFGKFTLLPAKQSGRIYNLDHQAVQDLRQNGFKYAVASSFAYELYDYGAKLDNQLPRIKRYKERFDHLFENYHYLEIQPKFKSFSFSNPTLRIIDLDQPITAKQ